MEWTIWPINDDDRCLFGAFNQMIDEYCSQPRWRKHPSIDQVIDWLVGKRHNDETTWNDWSLDFISEMIDWLIDWVSDGKLNSFFSQLNDFLIDWLIGWFMLELMMERTQLTNRSIVWSYEREHTTNFTADKLQHIDWLIDWSSLSAQIYDQ